MSTVASETVALRPEELRIVLAILQQFVPGKPVWAFGSRATGRCLKPFSDLDLAFEGTLDGPVRSSLADAFDDSDLPMKVDLVELGLIEPEFRTRIEHDFVRIV